MDLKNWFDSLTYAKVVKMVGDSESQVMDCKAVGEEKDVKRNLATALSGFANAEGGVVLWGVSAKKNAQGVDCIDSFPGIEDARNFASRLNELTPPAVSPGTRGVIHRSLVQRGMKKGFVATFVPMSEGLPHMARFGEDRYYQRIGLSFMRMEPFQIADMFGRRARPSLIVDEVKWNNFEYRVRITNIGRGTAQGIFIQIKPNAPFRRYTMGVDGNGNEALSFKGHNHDGSWLHAGASTDLLHPSMSIMIGGVWAGYDIGLLLQEGAIPDALIIEYKIGALDIQLENGILNVPIK